jgi:hypothetical protein
MNTEEDKMLRQTTKDVEDWEAYLYEWFAIISNYEDEYGGR